MFVGGDGTASKLGSFQSVGDAKAAAQEFMNGAGSRAGNAYSDFNINPQGTESVANRRFPTRTGNGSHVEMVDVSGAPYRQSIPNKYTGKVELLSPGEPQLRLTEGSAGAPKRRPPGKFQPRLPDCGAGTRKQLPPGEGKTLVIKDKNGDVKVLQLDGGKSQSGKAIGKNGALDNGGAGAGRPGEEDFVELMAGEMSGQGESINAQTLTGAAENAGDKGVNYSRPSGYRKGVRDKAWKNAIEDREVRDPLTQEIINIDDPWQMGHKPGYEFRKHQQSARKRRISRKEFLDEHNNPDHYQPELPGSNMSHQGEDMTEQYFGP